MNEIIGIFVVTLVMFFIYLPIYFLGIRTPKEEKKRIEEKKEKKKKDLQKK